MVDLMRKPGKLTRFLIAAAGLMVLYGLHYEVKKQPHLFDHMLAVFATGSLEDENLPTPATQITLTRQAAPLTGAVITLKLEVKSEAQIDLYVADTDGRRVRTLLRRVVTAGVYEVSWFGDSDRELSLSQGDYLVTLDCGSERRLLRVHLGDKDYTVRPTQSLQQVRAQRQAQRAVGVALVAS